MYIDEAHTALDKFRFEAFFDLSSCFMKKIETKQKLDGMGKTNYETYYRSARVEV